jgi:hypothetical protein
LEEDEVEKCREKRLLFVSVSVEERGRSFFFVVVCDFFPWQG